MDFTQLKILAETVGWPAVVVILLIIGFIGSFVFTHRISAKDDLIAAKDERISYLETRLKDAENFAPDILVKKLGERHASLTKELEVLDAANEKNVQLLHEKQQELEASRVEIKSLQDDLENILASTEGLLCPRCGAQIASKSSHTIWGEINGREIDADVEITTYECGLTLEDGHEIEKCGRTSKT